MKEKEQPELWINLLNHGSYEEIGRKVVKMLLSEEAKKETVKGYGLYHREIIVTGS